MYVDESGVSGMNGSPTRYYVLSGIVIHDLRGHEALNRLVLFPRVVKTRSINHLGRAADFCSPRWYVV
jgi:hypothetical protein